jgi:hypothetical protein
VHGAILILLSAIALAQQPGHSPWSPRWQTLLVQIPVFDLERLFPEAWWAESTLPPLPEPPNGYQLWAIPLAGFGHPALVAQVDGLLFGATFSPDESSICYVTLFRPEKGRAQLEVHLIPWNGSPTTTTASRRPYPVEPPGRIPELLAVQYPTWGPEGSLRTIPWPDPPGTALLDPSGQVRCVYEGAYFPSWSGDGRYLVLNRLVAPQGLQLIEFENPRQIRSVEGSFAPQPVRWLDVPGRLQTLRLQPIRRVGRGRGGATEFVPSLVQADASDGRLLEETPWLLLAPPGRPRELRSGQTWLVDGSDFECPLLWLQTEARGAQLAVWPDLKHLRQQAALPPQWLRPLPWPTAPRAPLLLEPARWLLFYAGASPGLPVLMRGLAEPTEPILVTHQACLQWARVAVEQIRHLFQQCQEANVRPLDPLLPWPPPQWPHAEPASYEWHQLRELARSLQMLVRNCPHPVRLPLERRLAAELLLYGSLVAGDGQTALEALDEAERLQHRPQERERLLLARVYALQQLGRSSDASQLLQELRQLSGTWYLGKELEEALQRAEQAFQGTSPAEESSRP